MKIDWISVHDRLPPSRTNVLTFRPDREFHGLDLRYSTHVYYDNYGEAGSFFIGSENYPVGDDQVYITHWAYLPDEPDVKLRFTQPA